MKKKPCEFCEQETVDTQEGSTGHQLTMEIYPENGFISVFSFADDGSGESNELHYDLPLNYCPNCGRKLVD